MAKLLSIRRIDRTIMLAQLAVLALVLVVFLPVCMAETPVVTRIPGGYDPHFNISPALPIERFMIPPRGGSASFTFGHPDIEVTVKGAENQTENVRGQFYAVEFGGNPQPNASLPSDYKLTTFIVFHLVSFHFR